jgi:hypothetical protein
MEQLPEVIKVSIAINARDERYVYRWFTKTGIASFRRANGTGSPDEPVQDLETFVDYCSVEIAEPIFGERWNRVQKIIDVSLTEIKLAEVNIPFGLEGRYMLGVSNALLDVLNSLLGNPNKPELVNNDLIVLITQVLRPDAHIKASLLDSLPVHIEEMFRGIHNLLVKLDDKHPTKVLFEKLNDVLEQYYSGGN